MCTRTLVISVDQTHRHFFHLHTCKIIHSYTFTILKLIHIGTQTIINSNNFTLQLPDTRTLMHSYTYTFVHSYSQTVKNKKNESFTDTLELPYNFYNYFIQNILKFFTQIQRTT